MQGRDETQAAPGPAGRTLLVCVDDEPEVLFALERALREEPYEFLGTDEPEQALDWVRSRRVGLIISDYRMPDLSGTSLLHVVRAISPWTARLMLTSYPREPMVLRACEKGLMRVLAKPWDDSELRRTIREHLAPPSV